MAQFWALKPMMCFYVYGVILYVLARDLPCLNAGVTDLVIKYHNMLYVTTFGIHIFPAASLVVSRDRVKVRHNRNPARYEALVSSDIFAII